jgi:putative sterol carrier protein
VATAADHVDYSDLYARWEAGNWRVSELDFSADRRDWLAATPAEQQALLWNCALFLHGEDTVHETLFGFFASAPSEEARVVLSTQQVDEARHKVFFESFLHEVAGVGVSAAATVAGTRDRLPWGYVRILELLGRVSRRLARRPSAKRLAGGLTLYHVIIEAGMAQNTLHRLEAHLSGRGIMPAFCAGLRSVMHDEQRHIALGVKILSDLRASEPGAPAEVAKMLRAAAPYMAASAIPPGWDSSHATLAGYTLEELFAGSRESIETRLRSAGMPVDRLPGAPVFPRGLSPDETARQALKLLRAGVLGPRNGPVATDAGTLASLFDLTARSLDLAAAPASGAQLQWDFSDAGSWHVIVSPSSAHAEQGTAVRPDVRIRGTVSSWCDVVAGRTDPLRAVAGRTIRITGRPAALARLPKLLGR